MEKIIYDTPFAEVMVFPEQDIITTSDDGIVLPDDEW